MALRAENVKPAGGAHLLGLRRDDCLMRRKALGIHRARGEDVFVVRVGIAGRLGDGLLVEAGFFQVVFRKELRVAAEHDVRAAARHVRRDRDRAELARLGDDLGFLLVVLRVQNVMTDARALEQLGEKFALFDADRTDQNGLPLFVAGFDLGDDGAVFAVFVFIHDVRLVDAREGAVCRHLDDVQPVDGDELLLLRDGGAGHAGELVVHTEVVLECDRCEGLVLARDVHMLLCLDRLVQTLAVASA